MASPLCFNFYWLISGWCVFMAARLPAALRDLEAAIDTESDFAVLRAVRQRLTERCVVHPGERSFRGIPFWIHNAGGNVIVLWLFRIHDCGAEKKQQKLSAVTKANSSYQSTWSLSSTFAAMVGGQGWGDTEGVVYGWSLGMCKAVFLMFLSFWVLVCFAKHVFHCVSCCSCQGFPFSKNRN